MKIELHNSWRKDEPQKIPFAICLYWHPACDCEDGSYIVLFGAALFGFGFEISFPI